MSSTVQSSNLKYSRSSTLIRSPEALRHTARCGRELPAEHAHQRGLAGTVGAYYAIAVAGSELEIDVPKRGFLPNCIPKLLTVIIMCGKISFLFEKRGRESSESSLPCRPPARAPKYYSCCRHTTPCGQDIAQGSKHLSLEAGIMPLEVADHAHNHSCRGSRSLSRSA